MVEVKGIKGMMHICEINDCHMVMLYDKSQNVKEHTKYACKFVLRVCVYSNGLLVWCTYKLDQNHSVGLVVAKQCYEK
jgi:hypothetical protein